MFGSVIGVLSVFGGEKVVFQREFASRMYSLPAYFLSRWVYRITCNAIRGGKLGFAKWFCQVVGSQLKRLGLSKSVCHRFFKLVP